MLTQSQFNEMLGRIKARQQFLRNQIQQCAQFAVAQSVEHRNATPADNLYQVLGKSMRRQTLVAYFEKFGNLVKLSMDDKGKACDKIGFFDVENMTGNQAGMLQVADFDKIQWDEVTKEVVTSTLDIKERVQSILKSVEFAAKRSRKVEHLELVDGLKALLKAA